MTHLKSLSCRFRKKLYQETAVHFFHMKITFQNAIYNTHVYRFDNLAVVSSSFIFHSDKANIKGTKIATHKVFTF